MSFTHVRIISKYEIHLLLSQAYEKMFFHIYIFPSPFFLNLFILIDGSLTSYITFNRVKFCLFTLTRFYCILILCTYIYILIHVVTQLQFVDQQQFFLASDPDLLIDTFKTEIAFLKTSWHMLGRPTVVLNLQKSLIGGLYPTKHITSILCEICLLAFI